MVDNESHEFVRWCDVLPAYSGPSHSGIPSEAYVHTPTSEVDMFDPILSIFACLKPIQKILDNSTVFSHY